MFEYKFVKIEFKKISGKPKEDYREVIKSHAEQGWRFVQIFSPDFATSGVAMGSYFELIFERPLQQNSEQNSEQ